MQTKENNKNWWMPAVQVFSEISTWIAFPIIIALIAGKALDKHYSTSPFLFIAFACFGFLVSAYGIIKTVKNFSAKVKKDEIEQNNKK